ncbi:MAG: hypothetical protein NXI15_00700 [Gammaproteobacteria bacterium]|nr:hypothetical protein [Gammaproteobacteria bacterium]
MTILGNTANKERRKITPIRRSVLIEINDEAYKQNTVYCPWHEILSGQPDASTETSPRARPTSAATR